MSNLGSNFPYDPFPNAPGAASGARAAPSQRLPADRKEATPGMTAQPAAAGRRASTWTKEPPTVFNAAVVAERLRLTAEFEELYRQHATQLEARARDWVREEAVSVEASEAASAAGGGVLAARSVHPEIVALEGEMLQESVLAEQLRSSEEAREAQLRDLQASRPLRAAARPPKLGESPASQLREALREADANAGAEELRTEVAQERAALRNLEQRSWRAQNAVRASEAHEDLLQAHRKDLERKLSEAQAQLAWVMPSGDVPAGVADEARQLPSLEKWEASLSDRARQSAKQEQEAQKAVVQLKGQLQDLEADVGCLWLNTSTGSGMGSQEAAHLHALLVTALPPPHGSAGGYPPTLDALLERLELQRQVVREELQEANKGSGWQAREQERLDTIAKEIKDLSVEAETNSEEAARYQAEMKHLPRATADVEDHLCEAADLKRENDVMRRQQSQWQKSQLRMLRLVEDMQRKRYRDVQTQATVAARLSELQKELPLQELSRAATSVPGPVERSSVRDRSYPSSRSPSPPKNRDMLGSPGDPEMYGRGATRLNAIWSDNVAMQSKLRRLEEERDELIRSQQSLITMAKSNMPTIEQARSNMRLAHAVGEPHFAGRRGGF